jgi:cysteine desulfurase / selenocysteine lyase
MTAQQQSYPIWEAPDMPFDVRKARRETPGCENVLHFNNAGAALMPSCVVDSVIEHIKLESEIGGYEAAARAEDLIENVYDATASLMNCDRDEIAIVDNATRAWDLAFYSLQFGPGDRILTCVSEYAANFIAFLQVAGKTGASIEVIPNDEHGQISIPALREAMDERVKLVSITHVPTNGGLVNPAAEVGTVARESGALYLLDACQSVGQMPIDVGRIGCHMLSATGRKFLRGPRGTGFLYVEKDLLERLDPPFLDLHGADWISSDQYRMRPDARRFEVWESNVAAKIGLGTAMDYALSWGLDAVWERVSSLAGTLRLGLAELADVTVLDLGVQKCGIVSFIVNGKEPSVMVSDLVGRGINVSVSPAKYTRLDMDKRGLKALIRASIHYYNTEEEIQRFCRTIAGLCR